MSSRSARVSGLLSMALLCLALGPAGAEIARPLAGTSLPERDSALAAEVDARLRQVLPLEAIEVRTANAGLVLSGQVSSADNLVTALTLAQGYAPGRVSNLMTIGHQPMVSLTLRLAEMPRPVAQNLSASMAMTGMFAPAKDTGRSDGAAMQGLSSGGIDVPGLIAALEGKGVLQVLASPTLTLASGQTAHLPKGHGCKTGGDARRPGLALDVTPRLAGDGLIEVGIRSCLAPGQTDEGPVSSGLDSTMTLRLQDGQTIAVAGALPETLRAFALTGAVGGNSVLGTLLHSDAYPSGPSEVMILITARIVDQDKAPPPEGPGLRFGGGLLLVGQPPARRAGFAAGQIAWHEHETVAPSFLK